jgi:hypothetical protein
MSTDQEHCPRCGKKVTQDMDYCTSCGTYLRGTSQEQYTVSSDELVKKIKELIHEGNVTRIIIKGEKGETLLEMPVTVGVVGTILVPWMAALGVIAVMATRCDIVVVRRAEPKA